MSGELKGGVLQEMPWEPAGAPPQGLAQPPDVAGEEAARVGAPQAHTGRRHPGSPDQRGGGCP